MAQIAKEQSTSRQGGLFTWSNKRWLTKWNSRVIDLEQLPKSRRMCCRIIQFVFRLLEDYSSTVIPNKECHSFQGHTGNVKCVEFVGERGERLISGSRCVIVSLLKQQSDNTCRIWDSNTAECLSILKGHSGRIWDVSTNQSGTIAASASGDSLIKVLFILAPISNTIGLGFEKLRLYNHHYWTYDGCIYSEISSPRCKCLLVLKLTFRNILPAVDTIALSVSLTSNVQKQSRHLQDTNSLSPKPSLARLETSSSRAQKTAPSNFGTSSLDSASKHFLRIWAKSRAWK